MLGSPVDIAIVAGLILIVFGPKKVPELGKALGQGIGNFKKALTEASDEVKAGVASVEEKDKVEKAEKAEAAAAASAPAQYPATVAKVDGVWRDGTPAKEEAQPPA